MRDDIEYVNETNSKPRTNTAIEILFYVFCLLLYLFFV